MVFGQQEFDNNVQTSNILNNGGNTFSSWRWVFKAGGTSARTFTGDGIRFFDAGGADGGIYNESSATHVLNIAVNGDGDAADPFQIHLNSTGGLTFGSTVNNQGGNMEILGTAAGAKTVRFNGVVSGAGGMYVNNANATVLFDAANTISGQLTINAGTVRLNGAGDTFGASTQAIRIGGGASLDLNNVSTTIGSVGEEGSADSGTISLGSGTLTVSGGATTYQNNISGTGGLTHSGTGTLNLFGTQSYTGTTTVSGGKISSGVALASSGITVSGGTFETSAANIVADTSAVSMSAGTYALGGNDTVGSWTISGGVLSTSNGSTLTAASYALQGGTMGANLGAGTATVTSGTTTLNGTLGSTTVNVNSGTMNLGAADRLANGAAVTVAGGTLGLSTFSDTVGSLTISSGTLGGSGTLTAATYALNGGTVSANLGTGTINSSSGTSLLNGTSAAGNVNVSGGLLSLVSANRLADAAAVAISSGELAVGGNDTVGSLAITGGLLSTANSSTLTAATYALNGGTVSANLGAGTATASSGTTLLSGTSAATVVNVTGGLLSLVSANRLADAAAVSVSSGTLSLGANSDTVGSLSTSGGTVSGAGTLTAATYALNGGTVSGNLGVGTATASSGTTTLSGTSAATVVNVVGGVLNTSGADKLADGAAVAVSSGTLGMGGSDTVGSLAASGTGVVTVASGTTLTANGNSSINGSSRATGGTVAIANSSKLTLANSSTTTTSDLSIGSGSTLAGTGGTTGQIKGSGLLSPGNSPGILTSGSVDLSGGIDFAFEFTAPGAPTYSLAGDSKNDLLHLTSGSTPFSGSFSAGNTVSFYFNDAGLSASLLSVTPTTYLGGFFVDSTFNIAGLLSTANMQYFIAAAGGTTSFNGVNYNLMSNDVASRMILSNVNQSAADFSTGTVNGTVLGVMAVPEPSSGSLLLAGIASLLVVRRFRKKA